jgi:hypothetical protein
MSQSISEEIFCKVLTDILQELEVHSNISVQNIVNEKLEEHGLDYYCDHNIDVDKK